MRAKEYIRKKLNKIRERIAGISFTYSYDQEIGYHVVYVEPSNIYNNNEEYKALEMELVSGFDETFPYENILVTDKQECFEQCNIEFVLNTISPERYIISTEWNVQIQSVRDDNNSSYALAA